MIEEKSFGIIPVRKTALGSYEVLLVRLHAGHWGFPKGHPEKEETPLETAKRELKEETALSVIHFFSNEPFMETYWYTLKGKKMFKTVSYYLAEVEGTLSLQKQELAAASWVSFQEAEKLITFAEGRKIVRQAKLHLS